MRQIYLAIAAAALSAATAFANDYSIVFDGTNDIGTLTRQSSTDGADLTFVDQFSFSEAGIDFSIRKTTDQGRGFALVNAGGTDAGLMVYAQFPSETDAECYPEITLSVPGGKIFDGKIYLSGPGLLSTTLTINGVRTEATQDGQLYFWSWESMTGSEIVTIKWDNTFFSRFIHSIDLLYSEDLQGKQASGLNFLKNEIEVVMGEAFQTPTLQNPHSLPLTWSSSDPAVATVDQEGKVTLVGGGKTMISVATDGDETYARGTAKYDLVVIPSASGIPQLLEYAPEIYDRVMVNFPATVMYGNSYFAFVTDPDGNAGCFENIKDLATSSSIPTIYSPGDVIPAGWIASNYTVNSSVSWQGIPEKVTETVEVTYPKVSSVSAADADRVLTLTGVTFTSATPTGYDSGIGTTADGDEYTFQDIFNIGSKPAGRYDVTGVVRYSKTSTREYLTIAPINYERSTVTGIGEIEASSAATRYYNLQGTELSTPPAEGIYIETDGSKAAKKIR